MAFLDKEGLKRLWANTLSLADSKVDKIEGKDLSTNDFTDNYKETLDELEIVVEAGAGAETVQQIPRPGKVTIASGETTLHFDFTGHAEANMDGRIEYGAVGNNSASFNGRSAALNKHAFAINNSTIAKGEESFAQGYETIAEGNSSVATGSRTWAKGLASHTEGEQTYTEGEGSHAEGALTKAMGRYSHAEGERTITNGDNSHAEGALTQTGSFAAHAEGNATVADTNAAHAEGSETKVISYILVSDSDMPDPGEGILPPGPDYNDYESMEDYRQRAAACAHAEGNHSVAMNYGAHAEGVSTKAYGHSSHTEGWDTQTGELMTAEDSGQTYQVANPEKGLGAHAEGFETKAIANYSHAEGFQTQATGHSSHVEGSNTQATEMYAHAEGLYTHADGQSSHAEGESTTAEGQYSHAEGFNTKAINGATHAEGYNVVAMADRSHAEGDSEPNAPETYDYTFTFDGKTYNGKDGAYGAYSHREGRNTLTLGDGSHVEGIGNIAHGLASHAEGFMTEANGNYSHASGLGTKANGDAQTVVGMYNKDDPNAKFIVGVGYSDNLQNAFAAGNDGTNDYITIGETKLTELKLQELVNSSASGGLNRIIVDTLPNPAEADSNTIYMLPGNQKIAHTNSHPGHLFGDVGGTLSGFGENPDIDCLFYPIVPGQAYTITSDPCQSYDYAWIVDSSNDSYGSGWIITELYAPGTFTAPENGVGLWVNVAKGTTPKLLMKKTEGSDLYEEYMLINGAFELIGNTSVDLSDYVHKSELVNYVHKNELKNYMTREEVQAYVNEVILGGEW